MFVFDIVVLMMHVKPGFVQAPVPSLCFIHLFSNVSNLVTTLQLSIVSSDVCMCSVPCVCACMCVCVCRVGICISVARVGVWLRISEAQGLVLHFHDYYGCLLPYGVVGVQVGGGGGGWVCKLLYHSTHTQTHSILLHPHQ